MREAGKAHQSVKLRRLGVHQHLAREASSELRYADAAGLSDYLVVIGKPQHRGRCEYFHGIGVGEGYLLGVHACCVLQHADHGGVIVPQLVQLQEV